jgi:hypothetical protein
MFFECNTPISDKLLNQQQVDALPIDTVVWIRWSGGNGPWKYRIKKQGNRSMAYSLRSEGVYVGHLSFVGYERYNDQVCLLDYLSDIYRRKE